MQNKSDAQLLGEYAAQHSDPAFAEIVARHTDLVYSAALRQTGSPDLAREIAQSVFTDLARKAPALAGSSKPDASLAGWLNRGTRFATLTLLRGERRRQAHEKQFMEHFNPASESAPDWERVAPVLDEAMAELDDADHEAVLLRYFKNQDFHAVGLALGVSDDTAQKRVSRAVERLREFFVKRGVTVGAQGLVVVISANAVQAAPAGLAVTLSTAAVLGRTTLTATATATATKAIAMTTLQKTLVAAALAVAIGTGMYEAREASRARDVVGTLQQQQAALNEQNQQLIRERDEATRRLATNPNDTERLNRAADELLKLRGELARLRASALPNGVGPTPTTAQAWLNRVNQLKEYLGRTPEAKIPELSFLTDEDWLSAVGSNALDSTNDYRRAAGSLRQLAKNKFVAMGFEALKQYAKANKEQFPSDISQLKPFLAAPFDDTILERYQISAMKSLNLTLQGEWAITEKAPVDAAYDSRAVIGTKGYVFTDYRLFPLDDREILSAYSSFRRAHPGVRPTEPAQLLPYANTAEEQAAVRKVIETLAAKESGQR